MALNFPDSPTLNQVYTDATSGFSYQWNGVVWQSYTASTSNNITILDDISGSFNGVTSNFPITVNGSAFTPANAQQLRIVLGGVIQEPGSDYVVSGSTIGFTTPPDFGLSFSGVSLGPALPAVGIASTGVIYVRQQYSPTGVQTSFTFTSRYTVGFLDVYRNGAKLVSGDDYTATDGVTFDLTPPAQNGDDVEAIGFLISELYSLDGLLDNLIVTGNAVVSGITTLNSLNVSGITTLNSLNVSGITTLGDKVKVGVGTTALIVEGDVRVTGILTVGTSSITLDGSSNEIKIGAGITISSTGITGSGSTVTSASVAYGLTGTPDVVVGISTVNTTLSLVGNYIEDVNAVAALDIDCSAGNYFTKTINGDSTFTVSNVPASGAYAFTLELTHTSGTITWFSGVEWPASTAPTLTTGKTHLFMFLTDNGGTRWRGSSLVDYTN